MGIKDMAQIKRIELLLDKYWKGESTVEEEEKLKDYFNAGNVAEHLKYIAPMFQVLRKEKVRRLDTQFEKSVIDKLNNNNIRSLGGTGWTGRLLRSAAVIIIFLGIGALAYFQIQSSGKNVASNQIETFETPEEAYAKVKQSLMLVSSKLNSGNDYIGELNKLNAGATLYNKQKSQKDEN